MLYWSAGGVLERNLSESWSHLQIYLQRQGEICLFSRTRSSIGITFLSWCLFLSDGSSSTFRVKGWHDADTTFRRLQLIAVESRMFCETNIFFRTYILWLVELIKFVQSPVIIYVSLLLTRLFYILLSIKNETSILWNRFSRLFALMPDFSQLILVLAQLCFDSLLIRFIFD